MEVSQRLTDLIFSLLGEIACSQGTMNNLTFGNDDFSHYETIGGGSGAMVGLNGTSAVQVHMTNTAITDPEILETRFPVACFDLQLERILVEPGNGVVAMASKENIFLTKPCIYRYFHKGEKVGLTAYRVVAKVLLVSKFSFARLEKELS